MIGRHAIHVDETKLDDRTIGAANHFMTTLRGLCFKTTVNEVSISQLEVTLNDETSGRSIGWISFDGQSLTFTPTEA